MRRADKMQHWLAETLTGRAECVSYATFFLFWLNALAVFVCWCDCPAFAWQSSFLVMFLLNVKAVSMLQNLFGLRLA